MPFQKLKNYPIQFHFAHKACLRITACILIFFFATESESLAQVEELYSAIQSKDYSTIRQLVNDDPAIISQKSRGRTPLIQAIDSRDEGAVRLLFELGANVDQKADNGQAPLQHALRGRNVKIINTVLDQKPDPDFVDANGSTPLMYAMMYRSNSDVAKRLLELGADVNAKNKSGLTALQMACNYRRPGIVLDLLEAGSDPNAVSNNGYSPFLAASASGLHEAVIKMIELGVSPVQMNKNKQTALHLGSQSASLATVKALLPHFDDVNIRDDYQRTPLWNAVMSNNVGIVKLLVAKGAKVKLRLPNHEMTPLHMACSRGDANMAAALIEGGADPNWPTKNGGHASLHLAAGASVDFQLGNPNQEFAKRYIDTISVLLKSNANTNLRNKAGQTPLVVAANRNFFDAVEALVEDTKELDFKLGAGGLLHWACKNGLEKTTGRLIESGISINERDDAKKTPLHVAAFGGHDIVVALLLDNQAMKEAVDATGQTPLHEAARGKHAKVVAQLLRAGCEPHRLNSSGRSALHIAAWEGSSHVVRILVDASVDANVATETGYTPLHAAAWQGHAGVVRRLLSAGGNVNATDSDGWTALHKAAFRGHVDAAKILLANNADRSLKNLAGMTAGDLADSNNNGVADLLKE